MHPSPQPPSPRKNQRTAPARILHGTRRTESDVIGLVVFLACPKPCCDPCPQITPMHAPAISVRGASDADTLRQAARPRSVKAMRLPRP